MTDRLAEAKQVLENYRQAHADTIPGIPLEVMEALAWASGEIKKLKRINLHLRQQIRHLRKAGGGEG